MSGVGGQSRPFDRAALITAFDEIGRAGVEHGEMLDLFVYGGSALMLASNFRFATEDVDIAAITPEWPEWFRAVSSQIAAREGWSEDWINEAVQSHLSPYADRAIDHVVFGSFPRGATPGLRVSVPSTEYMRALKLKAIRVTDAAKGATETADLRNLIRALQVPSIDAAIAILGRYFPRSAKDADRQRFFLKHIWPEDTEPDGTPRYSL